MIPYKEILLLLLGTLSTFLIWRIQYQKDKIKAIENQLSEKKYVIYAELIHILFDITNGPKIGKVVTQKQLVERLLKVKKDMFLYAPDDIFKTFTSWSLMLSKDASDLNHFKVYFQLMKMMRKDMGHVKTDISLDDFMLFYMQDEREYENFKKQNNW